MLLPYLKGTCLTIRADQDSLQGRMKQFHATGFLSCWRLQLRELEYKIVYCPVVTHQADDAFSCMTREGEEQTPLDETFPVFSIIADTAVQDADESVLYAN